MGWRLFFWGKAGSIGEFSGSIGEFEKSIGEFLGFISESEHSIGESSNYKIIPGANTAAGDPNTLFKRNLINSLAIQTLYDLYNQLNSIFIVITMEHCSM